jgi:hypothetical protein
MQLTRTQQFVRTVGQARILAVLSCLLFGLYGSLGQDKPAPTPARPGEEYSGMYTFLQEGEFVQITVEEAGRVTGFVSRYGDLDSDKGAFLDHFFKAGTLKDNKLSFTTEVVHGKSFEFMGMIERGDGKKPGDEDYYVIRGKLTENATDANKKVSARSREVAFKAFPRDGATEGNPRN